LFQLLRKAIYKNPVSVISLVFQQLLWRGKREKRWKQKEFSPRGTINFSSQIKKKGETETEIPAAKDF